MHWFEALIALPAIAYAGRPFFRSALRALRAGRTNMDVPISLAVILAPGMSLVETIRGGEHAYFDSAITLLFFLLIGRYLDQRARGSARSAAERLLALDAVAVTLLLPDGGTRSVRPGAARSRAGDPDRHRRARRRRRCGELRRRRARYQPDHRGDRRRNAWGRATGCSPARSISAPPLRLRVAGGRRRHPARRDRPADGAGRAAPLAVRGTRRSDGPRLRARGPQPGAR